MKLRVALDATAIPRQRLGAGAYVIELVRAMGASEVDVHLFVKGDHVADLARLLPQVELHPVKVTSRPARMAWSTGVLPARVRKLKPHVFHGPHYTMPARVGCPGVVTFHDPTFFTHPHLHERAKVAYFTRAAHSGIRRAARVIAPSEYARRGAIEHAGAEASDVDVVPEGVDVDRYRPGEPALRERPYILFVGALEPRKDVVTLIEAFDGLDVPHELVLVGPPAWGIRAIEAAVGRATKRRSIRRTGYVSDDEKIGLYRGADVFVYPSIAEGFGLPVLEAMACGAPVVTTTGSSPEEFARDAAMLVPPQRTAELRSAIHRVLTDEELARSLRARGPERASRYTWAASAARTIEVWQRAAGAS